MSAKLLAAGLVGLLLAGALASGVPGLEPAPAPAGGAAHDHAPASSASHDHAAHAHAHGGAGPADGAPFEVPRWREREEGKVPERRDAANLPHQFRSFRVQGDDGLAQMVSEGYLAGKGTRDAPYVIDGFRVQGVLSIADTTKALVVRNSLVEGQLKLNYNGGLVHVHHNRIGDLRVNENVEREAPTTAGIFEDNVVGVVGQLRHFGGEFARNRIGPPPAGALEYLGDAGPTLGPAGRAWNFDGYHLAWVHGNDVLGRVDVKLHGHHHGSCFTCPSHDHAAPDGGAQGQVHADEHQTRFHALRFEDNRIAVEAGDALRFYDRAHAGDDRTANSEPNPRLELEHAHHTLLHVARNALQGGALVLDVVNADDERHEGHVQEAVVHLLGNRVELPAPRGAVRAPGAVGAYRVAQADGLALVAHGNAFAFEEPRATLPLGLAERPAPTAGWLFERAAGAALLQGSEGRGAAYGVLLARAEGLELELQDNRFNAKEDVRRD